MKFILWWISVWSTPILLAQVQNAGMLEFLQKVDAQVSLHRGTGLPNFVRFSARQGLALTGSTSAARTKHFLLQHGSLFGEPEFNKDLRLTAERQDLRGFTHATFQQYHENVPIYDGILRFHYGPKRHLRSINGNYLPFIKVNTIPTIGKTEAIIKAKDALQQIYYTRSFKVEHQQLFIYRTGLARGIPGIDHLVYEFEMVGEAGEREFVFIDAHDGSLVNQYSGDHHILFRRLYDDNTSNEVWTEGDPYPGSLNDEQQTLLETSSHTYYMLKHLYGLDSYDGQGAEMKVIYNRPNSCPNASWNGSVVSFCLGTGSDDITAHEWAHAYTEYSSNLIYQWQAGALNESYSDIWGEVIDLINGLDDEGEDLSIRSSCGSSQRWMLGEDAAAFGGAIRDMWDPTCRNDPGKVSDPQYHCFTSDAGGVHTNSGVNNRAFSLLVDGGTFNGYTVNGLGLTKSTHIFGRANFAYLTATSDFAVQADALEMACLDLLGVDLEGLSTVETPAGPSGEKLTMADYAELQKVIAAVELRLDPNCNFIPLLDEDTILCFQALPGESIFYEDFEDGLTGWVTDTFDVATETWEARSWEAVAMLPDGRLGKAAYAADPINGDCLDDLQYGGLRLESAAIEIPTGIMGAVQMAFNHYVATEAIWDGANIKYQIDGGAWNMIPANAFLVNAYNGSLTINGNDNPLAGEAAFTGTDGGSVGGTWGISVVDLSMIGIGAGSILKLRFELGVDGCNGRDGWYLDDIRIYVCEDCQPTLVLSAELDTALVLFEASDQIQTQDRISTLSQIIYSAGNSIELHPDFEINPGAQLQILIDGCDEPPATPHAKLPGPDEGVLQLRSSNRLPTTSKRK